MAAEGISRRSLLLAGAGAMAGAALRPARGLAAAIAQGAAAGSIELGALGPDPREVRLPPGVAVAGLQWSGAPAGAGPRVRVRLRDGRWGPWTAAAAAGHGPDAQPAPGRGEPLWVGGATSLQASCPQGLSGVRLRYVLAAGTEGRGSASARAASLALAQPVLAAGSGQPPIIARAAWARGIQLPRVAPEYGRVELAFVHHTENPNGYGVAQVPSMLRAIFVFHRDVNGWNDIGYNFVVDLFGRVFEARAGGIDEPVVGAHAGGYNLASTGVAVLGSFTGTPISGAARSALQRLLAWKLALHGTASQGRVVVRVNPAGASYSKYRAGARVSLPRIAGHRDADSTDCPGDALYAQLPAVRRTVARLSGDPLSLTLALQAPAAPAEPAPSAPAPSEPAPSAPAPPAAAVPVLLATLASLDGTPVAGAPIVLQSRTVARRGTEVSHTALAEGVTDAEGRLELPATFAVGAAGAVWVRALHQDQGEATGSAAVSAAVRVEPVAAVSPPPQASGPSG